MISIRARLLSTLLPAFVGISIVAGFGIYFSTKAELEARLDARLADIAIDLRFAAPSTNRNPSKNNREMQRNRLSPIRYAGELKSTLFTNLPNTVYCEIWVGNRQINLKTDNLRENEITRPVEFSDDPVYYNATIEEGPAVRAWAAKLPMVRDKQSQKVILAIDRLEVDETLQQLAHTLVGGGVTTCALLSALLILSLKISLRPLRNLGEQAATMDAESLHERFPEKSAPADIRPIVHRLNNLMAKLEESFARERRFSGDLAHELRTPLAAIRTTSEVAIKWPDQASAEDFEDIHRLSSGLQQTLDSLLLLARMESSTADRNMESVSTAILAEECIALHSARADERALQFATDLKPEAQQETDPRLLRIIMTNLIGNAVDYAPKGSAVSIKTAEDGIIFQCLNDAPELSAEDVAHMFERMWRKDGARTESGHAGLGLSIAKACADALNLTISAELTHQQLSISLRS